MRTRVDQLIAELASEGDVTTEELADTWIVLATRWGTPQLAAVANSAVVARAVRHVLEPEDSRLQESSSRFLTSVVAERGSDRLVEWIQMSSSPRAADLETAVATVTSAIESHSDSLGTPWRKGSRSWKQLVDSLAEDMTPDLLLDAAAELASHHPELEAAEGRLRTMLAVVAARNELVHGIAGEPRIIHEIDDLELDATRQAVLAGEAIANVWDEPMLEPRAAARALGVKETNREKVRTYRERSWIVGIPHGRGYLYPEFQFNKGTRDVYDEVRMVNEILEAADDPWGVASWWVSRNARLKGARPVDAVGTERAEDIIEVAEAVSEPIG